MDYHNTLKVTYKTPDGELETEDSLTLAEETNDILYIEDELADKNLSSKRQGTLQSAEGCEVIGIIDFNEEDLEKVDPDQISEPPEKCLFLSSVSFVEQRDSDTVYVEFDNGDCTTLSGTFDRAYTY